MANQKVKTTGTGGPGRWCKREVAKKAAKKRRRAEDKQEADQEKVKKGY